MKKLEGITVIEFGEYVSVPMCARYFAEWGARVIKVERPDGDRLRKQCESYGMGDYTNKPYNHTMDMAAGGSREYISINTKTEEGLAVMHKLLESADVFLTNMRPKALKKMGLDYDSLQEKYPSLIYGCILGYGEVGNLADAPGYDAICFSARGGVMAGFPDKGCPPCNVPLGFGDIICATTLCAGVCSALASRMLHGKGDKVTVSLYGTALFMNSMGVIAGAEPYNNVYPKSRRDLPNPMNNTYKCKDGKWMLYCDPVYNAAVRKFFPVIGKEELLEQREWNDITYIQTIPGQTQKITDMLDEAFLQHTRDEWLQICLEKDLPGAPCYECDEISHDQFAWDNNFLRYIDYPDGFKGLNVDLPIRFKSQGLHQYEIAKLTGADTLKTLKSFGYSDEVLADYEQRGVIATKQQK